MDSTHDEPRSTVHADIENLHRELEQLCSSLTPPHRDQEQTEGPQPATSLFRGKYPGLPSEHRREPTLRRLFNSPP